MIMGFAYEYTYQDREYMYIIRTMTTKHDHISSAWFWASHAKTYVFFFKDYLVTWQELINSSVERACIRYYFSLKYCNSKNIHAVSLQGPLRFLPSVWSWSGVPSCRYH